MYPRFLDFNHKTECKTPILMPEYIDVLK